MLIRHWGASASGQAKWWHIGTRDNVWYNYDEGDWYPGDLLIAHFGVMWWSWWRRCCDNRQSQQVPSLESPCHLSHLNTIPLKKYRIDPTQLSSSWPSHILKSLVISGLGRAACKGSVSSLDHQILFWCFRFFTIRDESGDHQGKLVFAHFVTDCLCERAISFFIGQ